jgi:hypothetical protein
MHFVIIGHTNFNQILYFILLKMKTYFKNIVSTYFYKFDRNISSLLCCCLKYLNFEIPN